MAKSSTTITKENRDSMPGRGRSNKTLILEVIRENSMLDLKPSATKEESEKAFFRHIAKRAFDLEDQNSAMCLKLLGDKGWANLKPSNETVNFEFDKDLKPHEQASQVLDATSKGRLAPDVANTFIQSIKAMIDIEEYTSLKERIEKLEEALNGGA